MPFQPFSLRGYAAAIAAVAVLGCTPSQAQDAGEEGVELGEAPLAPLSDVYGDIIGRLKERIRENGKVILSLGDEIVSFRARLGMPFLPPPSHDARAAYRRPVDLRTQKAEIILLRDRLIAQNALIGRLKIRRDELQRALRKKSR